MCWRRKTTSKIKEPLGTCHARSSCTPDSGGTKKMWFICAGGYDLCQQRGAPAFCLLPWRRHASSPGVRLQKRARHSDRLEIYRVFPREVSSCSPLAWGRLYGTGLLFWPGKNFCASVKKSDLFAFCSSLLCLATRRFASKWQWQFTCSIKGRIVKFCPFICPSINLQLVHLKKEL